VPEAGDLEVGSGELAQPPTPRAEYSLTEFGVSLGQDLKLLSVWGREHMERVAKAKAG
jgi:DNA-binding HxlR family transcriptional regulator